MRLFYNGLEYVFFALNEQLEDIQIPCNNVTFFETLCQKPFMFRPPNYVFSIAKISIELQSNYRRGRIASRQSSSSGPEQPSKARYLSNVKGKTS